MKRIAQARVRQVAMIPKSGYVTLAFKADFKDLQGFSDLVDKSIDDVVLYAYKISSNPRNDRKYCAVLLREMAQKMGVPFHDVYVQCLRHAGLYIEDDAPHDKVEESIKDWESQGKGFKTEVTYADDELTYFGKYKGMDTLDDYEMKILLDIVKEEHSEVMNI